MYCNILTQKEHPKYRDVKKMVKLLLEFVEADCIYFSETDAETKIGILNVVVSKKSQHYYDEVYDHLWKLIQNHNRFIFCLFNRECIKDEVKRGNVFFILNCRESNLVYKKSGHKALLAIRNINMKKFLKKTTRRYSMWMAETDTTGRDLKYYRKRDNYLIALYVLQRQFRFLFINVSWFLTGEWILQESLSDQQEHVGAFNNTFGNVFDLKNDKEKLILEKLESVRNAIQWGEEIESLDLETVDYACEKLQWMKNEVQKVFQEQERKVKEIFGNHGN